MNPVPVASGPSHASPPRPLRVGNTFRNPGHHEDRTWLDVLRWKLSSRPAAWPRVVPLHPRPAPPPPIQGLSVTWIGHASALVQTPTRALLVDPVWSERVGPFGKFGPRRVHPPAITFETLPALDAILLSHDHYDHCDLPTLRRLARAHPRARLLVPLGCADLARRAGFGVERHAEFDWWQSAALADDLQVTATPARHWSNRLSGRRNRRLWCGWHLKTPQASLLFTGDTALDQTFFAAIRERLGAPDLALIPIGAYAPRWFMREQHCDPGEAVQIHLALGARRSLGVHWGTFPLTDEPREEPPALLAAEARAAGLAPDAFTAPPPSHTAQVG